jgi:hypothetical protein
MREDVIKDDTDQTYAFVDDFLEESIKFQVFMKKTKM